MKTCYFVYFLKGEAILVENWLPVIATSFNDTQRSILVVFEELIPEFDDTFALYDKQLYYIVSLLKDAVMVQFRKVNMRDSNRESIKIKMKIQSQKTVHQKQEVTCVCVCGGGGW